MRVLHVVPIALPYFDHNATTPVAPEVTDVVTHALREVFGNPSSIHAAGQTARQVLERSRRSVAEFLGGSAAEVVFTSGGTESNNLAILGLVRNLPGAAKHVITSAIEHAAVLESCRQLEREGVRATYLDVDSEGRIDVEEVRRHILPETVLVSVMHANNEVGTVQRLEAISAIVRERRAAGQQIFFHSDGVQAFGKIQVDVRALGVDLYAVSGHKIFAPKGIGGLYVAKGVPLRGIQFGGRHERERRAGTENVTGALAFARAVELCAEGRDKHVESLRDRFEKRVLSTNQVIRLNGAVESRLPNTSNLTFHGVSGEAAVIALDMQGMAVSSGSACSSGSIEPSHVLLAMGRTREEARSSVRFSFGRYNTPEEVDALADAVIALSKRLRKPAPKVRDLVES